MHTVAVMNQSMADRTWMNLSAVAPALTKFTSHGTSACSWCLCHPELVLCGTPAAAMLPMMDALLETSCTTWLCRQLQSASLDSSTPCSSESVSTENPNEENVWNCNTPLLVKNILLQTICFPHFFFFILRRTISYFASHWLHFAPNY